MADSSSCAARLLLANRNESCVYLLATTYSSPGPALGFLAERWRSRSRQAGRGAHENARRRKKRVNGVLCKCDLCHVSGTKIAGQDAMSDNRPSADRRCAARCGNPWLTCNHVEHASSDDRPAAPGCCASHHAPVFNREGRHGFPNGPGISPGRLALSHRWNRR